MPDYETKLVIKGEDKTAAATKSAVKNIDDITKALEKEANASEGVMRALKHRARETHQSYDQLLRNVIKTKQAIEAGNKAHEASANAAETAVTKQRAAVRAVSGEIVGMVSRYVSLGAAVDAARRSFMGFAEAERKLLLIQNQTKATTAEIEASGEKIRNVTRLTQTGFDETLAAANRLRNGLNISFDEAIDKTTRLNVVAKGLGAVPEDLAKLTSDMMRNMSIPAEEFNQTLEMIAATSRESSIEINDLIVNGSELAEVAKSIGYKGQDGLARLYAQLGAATEIMGDTSKGARLLTQTLGQLSSPQIGEAFGIPGQIWQKQIQNVKRQGGDVAAFVINKLGAVRDKESFLAKMGQKERLLFQKLLEDNNGEIGKTINNYKDLANGQQGVTDGMRVMGGAQGSIDGLTASVKNLSDQFGELMNILGVPVVINMFTKEIERLGAAIKWVGELIKWTKGEGEFPSIIGPHGFMRRGAANTIGSAIMATPGGMIGTQATDEAKKKLEESMQPPLTLPGLRAPGIPLPPGYKRSSYGGSADAAYLPANFQGGGGGGGGLLHRASLGGGGGGAPAAAGGGTGPGAYGGGTGYGGRGAIPRTGSGAPSPEPGGGTVPQAASGSYQGDRVNQDVMQTRIQQANSEWMKDPKNQQMVYRMLDAEGGAKNLGANLEQMSNYAAARGKTIQQVVEAQGSAQFYGPKRRLDRGGLRPHEREAFHSAWTPEKQKAWDAARTSVFEGGANRIGYRTDQGTVGDPNYDPNKMVKVGGNMFGVQPGTERWVNAQRGKPQVSVGGDSESTVASGARVPRPGEGGGEYVREEQGRVAGIRKGALSPETRAFLEGAGREHNLRADIYSGGQRMHGAPGATGSHRHDKGGSGDLKLWDPVAKRYLDSKNPQDAARMEAYTASAVKYGATGVGHGAGYMGTQSLHIGGGREASWGGSGWIERARRAGMAARGPGGAPVAVPAAPPAAVAEEPKGEGALQQKSRDVEQHVNLKVNDNEVQFARTSMRKQADREVREARWNSYSDIGAA